MMAFKSFPQTKNDRWIIQPRDESDDDFDSVFTAPACLVPPRRPIRNNAGGTWAKLEGKPPFLGHAAVAVFWIAVVSGLLLMLKRPKNWTAPGPMVRIPEEKRRHGTVGARIPAGLAVTTWRHVATPETTWQLRFVSFYLSFNVMLMVIFAE